ncbi:MAG TPA: hypothetical protein VE309_03800, partial [Caulobacteraceae bacterium]|nr:hypothetical protein [Caulobacteraceae bacterium]
RTGGIFRAEPWRGPEPAGGWGAAFAVFAGDDPAAPAMLGAYARDGEAIAFTPRFAPAPALRLRAVYRPPDGQAVVARFGGVAPPPRAPTTRVLSVTPSAEVWPENILKLYVTFSAPMRIGVAWDNIRIRDAEGAAMGGMFVEIDQELWDSEGRRLTVLFDPGRIKRGLVDNINEGPPLAVGGRYTLEIDAFWRDAGGGLLIQPFAKTIAVAPPLRSPVDPALWRLTPPERSTDPLIVEFDRPLDAALALRAITVRKGAAVVRCEAELEREETRLVLHPTRPWTPGAYALRADDILEDIAGNRIGRPFDIDANDPAQRNAIARAAELPFEI